MVVIMSMGYSKYISIVSIMVYYERFKYLYSMLFALKRLAKCKVYVCENLEMVWKWHARIYRIRYVVYSEWDGLD